MAVSQPLVDEFKEEDLIKYYFFRGFQYCEIRSFLLKYHWKQISDSTLKRRIKSYGLRRRNPAYDEETVRNYMPTIIDGPQCLRGYRSVWHALQIRGMRVPRIVVQQLLKETDPEGTHLRKAHRLKRRTYHNVGPNYAWHCDGYDKFGFPIHGCIMVGAGTFSWLYITRSNNQPNNIATYFLDAVDEQGGCPTELITDLGTESGLMTAAQAFLKDDENSHKYVPSTRNQRIESWWAQYN